MFGMASKKDLSKLLSGKVSTSVFPSAKAGDMDLSVTLDSNRERTDRDGKVQRGTGQEAGLVFQHLPCFRTCSILKVPQGRTSKIGMNSRQENILFSLLGFEFTYCFLSQ